MAKDRDSVGPSVRDELENLQRVYPGKSGLRLRAAGERTKRKASAATLYTYLESKSGAGGSHYAIHETLFGSDRHTKRSNVWWARFFQSRVFQGWKSSGTSVQREGIIDGGVVPSVNIRTRKQWRVRAYIGYAIHDGGRSVQSALSRRDRRGHKAQRVR